MKEFANAFKDMFFGQNAGQANNNGGAPQWQQNWGRGNCEWKKNRGLIVSVPKDTHAANPGETVMVEIIMKNNTHWPWKEGFTL